MRAAIARAPAAKARRGDTRHRLIAPVLAVLVISLFPITYTLFLSLQAAPEGLQALVDDPRLAEAARRTLVLTAIALPVEFVLGLALALLFIGRMPGKAIFISLMALPVLVAPVTAGTAWRMLFDNDFGPVNQILGWMTGGAVVTLWTTNADFALAAIVIADIWQWTPFMFVLFVAAIAGIDRGQLELAEINDTGPWRMLFGVVLPAIWPAVTIAILVRALDLLRVFDLVWVLTRGGPDMQSETLSVLLYARLLDGSDMAGAAALAFAGVVAFSLVATPFLLRLGRAR